MNPLLLSPARLARASLRAQPDERLVELTRVGSDAAFETIVARYRRPLLRHCRRIVGENDAEEAVQNALVAGHQAICRGDQVRTLAPWLRTVAHNAALNILRARAARPEAAHDRLECVSGDDVAEGRERLRALLDGVRALPDRQRDAIVMRELEGMSYEQIAQRLDASPGAVRQLLNRARNSLRERLGVLSGAGPLLRWLGVSGNGAAAARIGALGGGCALGAKLCVSALVPLAVVGAGLESASTSGIAGAHRAAPVGRSVLHVRTNLPSGSGAAAQASGVTAVTVRTVTARPQHQASASRERLTPTPSHVSRPGRTSFEPQHREPPGARGSPAGQPGSGGSGGPGPQASAARAPSGGPQVGLRSTPAPEQGARPSEDPRRGPGAVR